MVCARKGSDRHGYTLVELAVAVALVATVLALAAPAIPRSRADSDASGHELAQLLERYRVKAAKQGIILAAELSKDGRVLLITRDVLGRDSVIGRDSFRIASTVELESGARDFNMRVWFHPHGRAEGGPFVLRGSVNRVVEVNSWSGTTRVQIP